MKWNNNYRKFFYLLIIPVLFILYKLYLRRITDFGCFDDCLTYSASYYMTKGRHLYSEIFYNHQLLPAYINYFIQLYFQPLSIYELLLYSRKVILIFGYIFDVVLVLRFGVIGLVFAALYEPTKFYIFGDRFLAEGFVVYPAVYLIFLVFEKYNGKKIHKLDLLFSAILTWFIFFMREPFAILCLLMYGLILFQKKFSRYQVISAIVFMILSIATLLSVSISDFIFNVVIVNMQTVGKSEASSNGLFGLGLLQVFFYPIFILFNAQRTLLGDIMRMISVVYILTLGILFFRIKKRRLILISIIVLASANLRFTPPGSMFYAAFHMIVWYGLFIATTGYFTRELYKHSAYRLLSILSFGIIIVAILYSFISKASFFHESIDRQTNYIVNYGTYIGSSEVYKTLASSGDTLFLDGWDELIYFQSGLVSDYPYSLYTSVMPQIKTYTIARDTMFKSKLPNFYYGSCKDSPAASLSAEFMSRYVSLYQRGEPSCVHILDTTYNKISEQKWKMIDRYNYYLPEKVSKTEVKEQVQLLSQ